ncbi:hypothetical protein [Metallosphaera hakonensis]|uniref:Uncharacterized protein n=1 Tax=Metallosphaera hakonensis JCM 8857 = DSM 7519 TaxID=1293036 RepID=A0A2U9IVS7_9CREN|nr:hypothetical protein [Metallosphaera hakonensis]AWS00084.1 hypothetical protein DFR87_10775 [Metallosphaera hakonensis JCM 8857 = DSM 7519]
MGKNGNVTITRDDNGFSFDGIKEAFSIGRLHVSPFIDGIIHFYIEGKNLLISLNESEFLDVLFSISKEDTTLTNKGLEISQIGIVYKLESNSLEIINVADWSFQSMFTLVNGERVKLTIGPNCEYNDCVYLAVFPLGDRIFSLKIRFSEGSLEAHAYSVLASALENELIFHMLKHTLRLF